MKGKLYFSSSKPSVASVNASTGQVTGKQVGSAKISVYVKAKGSYKKSNVLFQSIKVTKPSKPTLSKVSAGKNSLTVSWKKTTSSGYVVEYAEDKKFKKSKLTKIVKGGTTQKFTIKNLKKGTTYYVRVYAYGYTTKIRSAASGIKNQKAK